MAIEAAGNAIALIGSWMQRFSAGRPAWAPSRSPMAREAAARGAAE